MGYQFKMQCEECKNIVYLTKLISFGSDREIYTIYCKRCHEFFGGNFYERKKVCPKCKGEELIIIQGPSDLDKHKIKCPKCKSFNWVVESFSHLD